MGKKNNSKPKQEKKDDKKPFFSDRQKKVLLIVIALMLLLVPVASNFRCKAACFQRVTTPYPEIACKYQCPWFWERK